MPESPKKFYFRSFQDVLNFYCGVDNTKKIEFRNHDFVTEDEELAISCRASLENRGYCVEMTEKEFIEAHTIQQLEPPQPPQNINLNIPPSASQQIQQSIADLMKPAKVQ